MVICCILIYNRLMDRNFLRHLEEQFGNLFICPCSAPFDRSRFEIVKETETSLVAHYTCSRCGRDHVMLYGLSTNLATSMQTDMEAHEVKKFTQAAPISADDVLEVRDYFKNFKGNFRSTFKVRELPDNGPSGSAFSISS
jgi:hypothetical protein